MLLRRTSVMSGAKALALAGLLGLASGTVAQPPAAPAPKPADPPQKSAPPAALVQNPVNQESVLSLIGNKPSGNVDVSFGNGHFVFNGQPISAGNEYAVLEGGSFRGIVTSVDDSGARSTLPGANLYLIRRGQVVARTVSGPNGGFAFTNVTAGGYTLLATVGGYGTAEVALGGVPGVDQGVVPYAPVIPRPVASPYLAGMTAGVPGAVSVRFPYQAMAVQRIALRDGAVAPAGVSAKDAKPNTDGVLVKAAASQPGVHPLPVINLSPAPWEDLRLLVGTAQFDTAPLGLAPTPAMDFGGGGFGGGGGGGGFGGAGALAALAAAAGIAAAAGGGGDGGGGGGFASPFRP